MRIKATGLAPIDFEVGGNRYLIEPYSIDQVAKYDIVLPQDDEESRFWNAGKIVAVGDGNNHDGKEVANMKYYVGDIVTWERLSGREYFISGKRYHMVFATHILARLTNSEKWLEVPNE